MKPVTWKTLVRDIVDRMPREFTLADVLKHRAFFEKHYPENRFVDAKIRQSLQMLRDQGALRFLGAGHYESTGAQPRFSPLIDLSLATDYTSLAQGARVIIENWAEENLYCLNCEASSLARLSANTPLSDFACAVCETAYQVKSKGGRFGATLIGANYGVTIAAARERRMPEHILVEYDRRYATVVFVDAVPGKSITPEHIVARKPLTSEAKRAGWQGCNVLIGDLPHARIVAPAGIDPLDVRSEWRKLNS